MTWTMDNHWQGLPATAGARMLAALIVAAPALVLLPDSAAAQAQATAAQQNAVRHYCRADFAEKCPGVRAGEALLCLEANLDDLSRTCKKAVLAAMGADSESKPVADAEPPPPPRAASRTAPIVSTKPPSLNTSAQRVKRRGAPGAATNRPPSEPPPPNFATSRKATAAHEAAADALPPNGAAPNSLPPDSEQAKALPPERVTPSSVAPARRAGSAAPRTADPLVRACWNELVHHCRGMRPGRGRELACLTQHSHSLSPRCWDAYRTARSARR